MSNLEHYFENLLFYGQDIKGDWNKNTLTDAEQEAVRICADYVLYDIFLNRDDFLKFIRGDSDFQVRIAGGEWINKGNFESIWPTNFEMFECTACGEWLSVGEIQGHPDYFKERYKYCPMCGARLSSE